MRGLRHLARWGVGMTAWCQEGAARYAGAVHGARPTERAGVEHVTGRGWHGADARERGAPGRGGDDGRDGGGCMHPDAGRPCCGPERRSDPSVGQVCAAARRFCCSPHGSPHPSLKKHHPLPPRLPCRMGNRVLLWTGDFKEKKSSL
jgi:hypothetical protein